MLKHDARARQFYLLRPTLLQLEHTQPQLGARLSFALYYKNKDSIMRRKDREISEEETLSILSSAEYGVLSTVSNNGMPYGVPLSFCIIDRDLYFHCAVEGRKLENLNQNNYVSFCVVGNTELLPDKFGTKYESVILSGKAIEAFKNTKRSALEGLLKKYSSSYMESDFKYIDKLTDKTRVFKIEIEAMSGKSRKM